MTQTTPRTRTTGAVAPSVRSFADLGMTDTPTVGGKGANLGEMTRAGLPVPPGFVVTADAYLRTIEDWTGSSASWRGWRP